MFGARVRQLINWLHESGENVRLPGERRYANRALSKSQGIIIDKNVHDFMMAYLE